MSATLRLFKHFCTRPGRLFYNARYWATRRRSHASHVFIWGCPRSGTTLLKSILVAHPAIAGTDRESTGLFNFRDVCDFEIGELSRDRIQDLLACSRDLIEFYDAVAQEFVQQKDADVFVDKIQPRRYRLAYVLRHFDHARFINIVRDGRDCYCSARRHPNVVQARAVADFAKYWAETLEYPIAMIPASRLHTLRYEELARQPEAVLERIMQFLDQPFMESQTDVSTYSQTSSMRKRDVHRNLAKPINSQSVDRWRTELSELEKREFFEMAGSSLQRYGYSLE